MRILQDQEFHTLEHLLKLNQETLRKTMAAYLRTKYKKVEDTKDYVIAHGDIPIALVAHMDTVFFKIPEELFYDTAKNVMWSPTGAGFDDRAGIYAILQIVKQGLRPHIILTTDEEVGALGASVLATRACPFKDLRYLIQLDRRGSNDCVFYDCDNPDFVKYVEGFGFVEAYGTFSDISTICPAWKIAGVNLSIGYRDEHTASETLFVGNMLATIDKVITMLQATDIPSFKYVPLPYLYDERWLQSYYRNRYGWEYDEVACASCRRLYLPEEMIPVIGKDNHTKYFCPDCVVDKVVWCTKCGTAHEGSSKSGVINGCICCPKEGVIPNNADN